MINNPTLRKLLGYDRFHALDKAFKLSRTHDIPANISTVGVLCVLLLGLSPLLTRSMDVPGELDLTTGLLATLAGLALVVRFLARQPFLLVLNWKHSLSLTHTAFALGCIPILIIAIFMPEALYTLQGASTSSSTGSATPVVSRWGMIFILLQVSVWAGFSEELLYRGLVLSVVRRWTLLQHNRYRDHIAILLSATVFAAAHLATWGVAMSLAVWGLGIGLGVAYIVLREALLPLIVYHAAFDFLSLLAAFALRRL